MKIQSFSNINKTYFQVITSPVHELKGAAFSALAKVVDTNPVCVNEVWDKLETNQLLPTVQNSSGKSEDFLFSPVAIDEIEESVL